MKDKIERTIANRRRRMEKDKNEKERARRKRSQRQSRREMALLASPDFDPRFVNKRTLIAITRKHFGLQDTATRIQDFLDDEGNIVMRHPQGVYTGRNRFKEVIMRRVFPLADGRHISIQQGASHYCGEGSVEICGPWHECMGEMWSRSEDGHPQIFIYVPLAKAAEYVDALEGRGV